MLNFFEKEFSLSGLAAWVLTIRVGLAWGELRWPEAICLFLVLFVHYGKNWNKKTVMEFPVHEAPKEWESRIALLSEDVKRVEDKISGINLQFGIKTLIPENGAKV